MLRFSNPETSSWCRRHVRCGCFRLIIRLRSAAVSYWSNQRAAAFQTARVRLDQSAEAVMTTVANGRLRTVFGLNHVKKGLFNLP